MDKKRDPGDEAGSKAEHNPVIPSITQLEKFAHAYTRHYGLYLFPAKPGGKTPITAHGVLDATNDMDEYQKLHNNQPHNIAVATGPKSGIFVLDVDPRHGGHDTLRALLLEYGPMVPTWQALTQSGGGHYYFRWDEKCPVNNRAGILPGLDIRGDGGYVVMPPSYGPDGTYEWIRSPSKAELLPAPKWLVGLLQQPEGSQESKDLSHLAKGVQNGQRNVSMTQVVGTLLGRGVDMHLAWALVDSYNRCYVNPPIEEKELLKTFQSITNREIKKRERQQRKWGA